MRCKFTLGVRLGALTAWLPAVALIPGFAAHGADIPLAIIGPHEYDLPVDFKPFNVVVQYGDGNAAGSVYDSGGQRRARGGSHTWSGMTKYVHFRSFDAIPHVSFAFELIQSEAYTLANGQNWGGLGTTIVGPAGWFKPNKHSTLGIQTFMETPSGTRDSMAMHYWANLSSIIFDYEWKHFSFDGDLGSVVSSTKHRNGEHSYSAGNVFYTNLRFSWKASSRFEPFFSLDWQNSGGMHDNTSNLWVANSSSRETALGVGAMIYVTKRLSITPRYSHSVEGRNVAETNAYYMKIAYLF